MDKYAYICVTVDTRHRFSVVYLNGISVTIGQYCMYDFHLQFQNMAPVNFEA